VTRPGMRFDDARPLSNTYLDLSGQTVLDKGFGLLAPFQNQRQGLLNTSQLPGIQPSWRDLARELDQRLECLKITTNPCRVGCELLIRHGSLTEQSEEHFRCLSVRDDPHGDVHFGT
jgi:hypothetical protein